MPDPVDPKANIAPDPNAIKKPDEKQPIIDEERINSVLQANEQLQQRVTELEKKPTQSPSIQTRGWDQVSERDLEYIVTHPNDYPDHTQGALSELRKRDRESIRTELSGEIGTQTFMTSHKEAFDQNTPLGQEVTKILKQNRSQPEVLSDVIELAKHRIEGGKKGKDARQQVVNALKASDAHAPGSETITTESKPSFMDMPKAEFEKELQGVKMKTFKQ